jgi:hypothetical protein
MTSSISFATSPSSAPPVFACGSFRKMPSVPVSSRSTSIMASSTARASVEAFFSSPCWSTNLLAVRTKSNSVAMPIAVLKSSSIAARNFSRRAFTSSPAAPTAAFPARRSRQGRA